ncbi:Predicted transporter (major facilitator superfamily) [Phaffia rhodozyma]|uniref:Predicted transporter (Major facilitator superfamily) n=1 Tax=Phaffia rhodozyma TaxID=264483 RepID=A0A0F7SQT3_PHARH|nr:Predicted transporter (major facilitator superfamily) [Phaffia rhodozyma]
MDVTPTVSPSVLSHLNSLASSLSAYYPPGSHPSSINPYASLPPDLTLAANVPLTREGFQQAVGGIRNVLEQFKSIWEEGGEEGRVRAAGLMKDWSSSTALLQKLTPTLAILSSFPSSSQSPSNTLFPRPAKTPFAFSPTASLPDLLESTSKSLGLEVFRETMEGISEKTVEREVLVVGGKFLVVEVEMERSAPNQIVTKPDGEIEDIYLVGSPLTTTNIDALSSQSPPIALARPNHSFSITKFKTSIALHSSPEPIPCPSIDTFLRAPLEILTNSLINPSSVSPDLHLLLGCSPDESPALKTARVLQEFERRMLEVVKMEQVLEHDEQAREGKEGAVIGNVYEDGEVIRNEIEAILKERGIWTETFSEISASTPLSTHHSYPTFAIHPSEPFFFPHTPAHHQRMHLVPSPPINKIAPARALPPHWLRDRIDEGKGEEGKEKEKEEHEGRWGWEIVLDPPLVVGAPERNIEGGETRAGWLDLLIQQAHSLSTPLTTEPGTRTTFWKSSASQSGPSQRWTLAEDKRLEGIIVGRVGVKSKEDVVQVLQWARKWSYINEFFLGVFNQPSSSGTSDSNLAPSNIVSEDVKPESSNHPSPSQVIVHLRSSFDAPSIELDISQPSFASSPSQTPSDSVPASIRVSVVPGSGPPLITPRMIFENKQQAKPDEPTTHVPAATDEHADNNGHSDARKERREAEEGIIIGTEEERISIQKKIGGWGFGLVRWVLKKVSNDADGRTVGVGEKRKRGEDRLAPKQTHPIGQLMPSAKSVSDRPSQGPTKHLHNERDALLSAANSPSSWGAIQGVEIATEETEGAVERSDVTIKQTDSNTKPIQNGDQTGEQEEQERLKGWRLGITLLSVWGTNLTFAVSATAVATLSPTIAGHFNHIELSAYIGSIFSLISTVATPVFGGLTDHFSRTHTILLAGVLFFIGTIVCAFATSMNVLLIGRAIMGAGGAGILTLSSLITTDLTTMRERGFYQGLMMVIFGLGGASGGPFAGWVSDRFGWRIAFLLQLPLLVVSLAALTLLVPRQDTHSMKAEMTHRSLLDSLDLPGTLILFFTIASLLLAFSFHSSGLAWGSIQVFGLLVFCVAGTVTFIVVEGERERNGGKVLIPRKVMRRRNVLWTSISAFLMSMASASVLFFVPLYYTIVRSSTSTSAGMHLLPNSISLSIGSLLSGHIIKVSGKYRILGVVSLTLPIWSSVMMSRWDTEGTNSWHEWGDLVPAGLGYSSFLVTSLIAIISSVPRSQIPKATSISYLFRTLGMTLGIAICSAFQQAVLGKELTRRITCEGSEQIISSIVHSKSYILTLSPHLRHAAITSYSVSIRQTFILTASLGVLAFLSAIPIGEFSLGPRGSSGKLGSGSREEDDEENRTSGRVGAEDR